MLVGFVLTIVVYYSLLPENVWGPSPPVGHGQDVIHTSSAFEYSTVISNHTCISLTTGSKTPDLSSLNGKRN